MLYQGDTTSDQQESARLPERVKLRRFHPMLLHRSCARNQPTLAHWNHKAHHPHPRI